MTIVRHVIILGVLLGLPVYDANGAFIDQLPNQLTPQSPDRSYDKAIRIANIAYANGKYAEAKRFYLLAQKAKKTSYVTEQIAKIDSALRDKSVGAYEKAIIKGDAALADQDYNEAVEAYTKALAIRSSAQLKAKLQEVEALLADRDYKDIIQKADVSLAAQQVNEAEDLYVQALAIKPDDQYAKKKVEVLQADSNYKDIIQKANASLAAQQVNEAEDLYVQALAIKPDDQYAKNILAKLQAEKAKEARYQVAIANGNTHYAANRFKAAEIVFTEALTIKPADPYSLNQLQRSKDARKREEDKAAAAEFLVNHAELESKMNSANQQYVGRFGTSFHDCPDCPAMVVVKAGFYTMGSNVGSGNKTELPAHEVAISSPFAVGIFEVTFKEWDVCVKEGACTDPKINDAGWGRGDRPLIFASWQDAQVYVKWLQRKTGKPYRLLTEAEWEYVARAGSVTNYWWGNNAASNKANCNGCGSSFDNSRTAPVGTFMPNNFGIYNTSGNVWEWVEDCYNADYNAAPRNGSAWLDKCDTPNIKVLRGGSWGATPDATRSAFRKKSSQVTQLDDYGFRVAYSLEVLGK